MILDVAEDKNPEDEARVTPLHKAAGKDHLEIFKMIFDVVEEKNPKDLLGHTPYEIAKTSSISIRNLIENSGYALEEVEIISISGITNDPRIGRRGAPAAKKARINTKD